MARVPSVLRDINMFFNNQSYAGLCNLIKLPNVGIKTTDFVASGWAGDLERSVGKLNKLECEVTISAYDRSIIGNIGNPASRDKEFIFRGAVDTGDGIQTVVVRQRGLWKGFEHNSDAKPEEEAAMKFAIVSEFYNLELDGQEVIYIDKQNNVVRINGVDLNEEVRKALAQ